MSNFYYNLSGGINTAKTRIGMGQDTKKLYWWDSKNVEILKNQGVCRQKGNVKLFSLNPAVNVLALHEYPKSTPHFVFATSSGEIYSYNDTTRVLTLLHTFDISPNAVSFTPFLDGIVIAADNNPGVYYKQGKDIKPLGLQNADGEPILSTTVGVFASRVWVAAGSTVYFSALGTYNNWTTDQDAGYISKFHSSTTDIVAMKEYCNNLAIYKADGVYLLSGSSPADFAVTRLANIGTMSSNSVVCADNKQYFINDNGIFYLGQAGMLSQIALSSNIANNIKEFFEQINYSKTAQAAALLYDLKIRFGFSSRKSMKTIFKRCTFMILFVTPGLNGLYLTKLQVPQQLAEKFTQLLSTVKFSPKTKATPLRACRLSFNFQARFFILARPRCAKLSKISTLFSMKNTKTASNFQFQRIMFQTNAWMLKKLTP
jgi:hypothetical protein